MSVQTVVVGIVCLVVGFALSLLIGSIPLRRKAAGDKEERVSLEVRRAETLKKTRDHQLNHGREVYNWLEVELKPYLEVGIKMAKIEKNGEVFSINFTDKDGRPILQLSYDFVGYQAPYLGHVHYGAYGADMLFWVGDHAPFAGFDRIVFAELDREEMRVKQIRAREIASR